MTEVELHAEVFCYDSEVMLEEMLKDEVIIEADYRESLVLNDLMSDSFENSAETRDR